MLPAHAKVHSAPVPRALLATQGETCALSAALLIHRSESNTRIPRAARAYRRIENNRADTGPQEAGAWLRFLDTVAPADNGALLDTVGWVRFKRGAPLRSRVPPKHAPRLRASKSAPEWGILSRIM